MQEWVDRDSLCERAEALVQAVPTVMDIGCGIRPQMIINAPKFLVCVEAHDEYIRELQRRFKGTTTVIIQGRVPECLTVLPDRCIDTVMMLDFIEHLDREAGLKAISECERIARRQIVVFTPLGFMPQDESGETDGWGLHGQYWQMHRSGWTPDDFDERWHVVACRDFHAINGKGERLSEPHGALWAVLNLVTLTDGVADTVSSEEALNIAAAGLRQRELEALSKEIDLRRRESAVLRIEKWLERLSRWRLASFWKDRKRVPNARGVHSEASP